MADKKRVLVLMPISKTTETHTEQYWTRHYNSYLKTLIEKVENIEVSRCEPLTDQNAQQIALALVETDVVVADLTDLDPSVLWELGVRHSFKQSTITMAEAGSQMPFQFSLKGILQYNGDYLENQVFEEKLKTALDNCLKNPKEPDSPVLETFGGRSTIYGIMRDEENTRRIQALKMELNVDETLLGQIFDNCLRNKTLRSENKSNAKRMTTTPLKTAAIEFLLVNRYLDMDKSFYSALYACHNFMEAINNHLVEWESTNSDKQAEDWLLGSKEATYKYLNKLKEYLQ
jgi:hypothetical protein